MLATLQERRKGRLGDIGGREREREREKNFYVVRTTTLRPLKQRSW